jgi:hypothetical protein
MHGMHGFVNEISVASNIEVHDNLCRVAMQAWALFEL